MSIRDKMIEIGSRALCLHNNEDPNFICMDDSVTLGQEPRPNWKHWEPTVVPIIDALLSAEDNNFLKRERFKELCTELGFLFDEKNNAITRAT